MAPYRLLPGLPFLALILAGMLAACGSDAPQAPPPTNQPAAVSTVIAVPTPTDEPAAPTPMAMPTASPSSTLTPKVTPTATLTLSPTPAPMTTPVPTATPTPASMAAATPTPEPTTTPTPEPTPQPTATPMPTPYVYEPVGKFRESDRILLDITYDIDDATMDLCMQGLEFIYSRLEELYGNSPDDQYILFVENEFAVMRPVQVTVPFGIYPEWSSHCGDSLTAHETSHWFTYHLIETSQLWFSEGLAAVAELFIWGENSRNYVELEEFRHAGRWYGPFEELYEMLQSGENIFRYDFRYKVHDITDAYGQVTGAVYSEHGQNMSAHETRQLFFIGLEKVYDFTGKQIQDLLKSLSEIPKCETFSEEHRCERVVEVEDIIKATEETSGKDISPLIALLEPGIKFNSYTHDDYKTRETSPRVLKFFDEHPQYNTERVSWLDSP